MLNVELIYFLLIRTEAKNKNILLFNFSFNFNKTVYSLHNLAFIIPYKIFFPCVCIRGDISLTFTYKIYIYMLFVYKKLNKKYVLEILLVLLVLLLNRFA